MTAVELTADTDNVSGAFDVYLEAGVKPVRRNHTFVKELRPGRDLAGE